jgi:hypothetical protein
MSEENKKTWRDIYKWTLFLWGILFLVWGIWFLVTKRIPEFSQIKLEWQGNVIKVIFLPFKISRLWDFLVLPLWPITYALIYNSKFFSWCYREDQLNIRFNNWISGVIIGAWLFNVWAAMGSLLALIFGIVFLFIASIHSEIATYDVGPPSDLCFTVKNVIYSVLLNFSSGMTIGLFMVFSIGLVPGLVIGLTSFLIMTLFQYTLVKFFRIVYYLFKLKILPWLGIKINDC